MQSGQFLGRFLSPLLETGLPSTKNLLKPLPTSVLSVSRRCSYSKEICGSGTTTLIITNEEIKDIMEIVEYLKEFGLLIKSVRETIKNEVKEQKGRFLSMFSGTLGASLLRYMLAGKGSEFHNRSMEFSPEDNDMCSTHNKETYVAAERFIKTLKNKN